MVAGLALTLQVPDLRSLVLTRPRNFSLFYLMHNQMVKKLGLRKSHLIVSLKKEDEKEK